MGELPAVPTQVPTATIFDPPAPSPTSKLQPTSTSRPKATAKPTTGATRTPPKVPQHSATPRSTATRQVATLTATSLPAEPTSEPTSTPADLLPTAQPTQEEATPEQATPEARDFDFIDQSDYVDEAGIVIIVGLVQYTGAGAIADIEIAVDLEDAEHNVLATENAETVPLLVQPDGLIPFKATFLDAPDTFEYFNTTVQGDTVDAATLDLYTTDLEVVQSNIVQGSDANTLRIVGKVKNTSPYGISGTEVIAALLDADGNIIDVSSAFTTLNNINTGQQSAFEIRFQNGDGGVSYKTAASAILDK
ncbi:MAG: FxLYD domain-containing protein [Chloroflexota bacterium]